MDLRGNLRDRVLAADPGLTRLYIAARATASVGTALGILLLIAHRYGLPLSVPLLGAAISITWSISVMDPDVRSQRITTLLIWMPAAVAVAAGTLAASNRYLQDGLFLAVLFGAVYIRRFGPRFNAIGTVTVLSFFFTLFLNASAQTLPWLIAATGVACVCTYFYRFVVFRDRPQQALQNAFRAFRARQRLIAHVIAQAARAGSWNARLRREVAHHEYRLNDTAIIISDLLRSDDAADVRAEVLDTELETQAVVGRALEDPRAPVDLPRLPDVSNVRAQPDWTPRGAYRVGTNVQTRFLQPATRQAIQLTAGAAVAIVAGELLSPQRWYWAVLTTFLVFTGVSSAGEALVKGWNRVAGTALGIAAGAAVAAAVRGHTTATFALMFVFLFAAAYMIRVSYAVFTFFLTAVLSMLYVLIGSFSDRLLVLRLIETIIGATCGGVAALLLFPIRTRDVLGSVSTEALGRLADAVQKSVRRASGDISADPLTAVRQYDEALQSLRTQIEPLVATFRFQAREPLQARLALYGALGRYARQLAVAAYEKCPVSTSTIVDAGDQVVAHIDWLRDSFTNGRTAVPPAIDKPPDDDTPLQYLYRIDRAVHRLARIVLQGADDVVQ
ncbi:MAG TPA: FUSC family protein [Candidatus Baltobacteraceae bacterium]|jgi:uncharacterized membrane protein YccC|nr:FUSC family protein [Candidatus Baltobacteraceae bacterium]